MASYNNDFLLAFKRTADFGLPVDPFSISDAPQRLTHEHGVALMAIAARVLANYGELSSVDIACQCARVSRLMKDHVEQVTGHQAMLTIGSVSYSGTPLIEVGAGDLAAMARGGSFHVWLTLPWAEIIDFTLQLSIAVLKGLPIDGISPLVGYPESLSPFSWKPLYVGAAATDILLNPS